MFSLIILSTIDEKLKSVKDTWAVSEKDKVTFLSLYIFRNTAVELHLICAKLQLVFFLNSFQIVIFNTFRNYMPMILKTKFLLFVVPSIFIVKSH